MHLPHYSTSTSLKNTQPHRCSNTQMQYHTGQIYIIIHTLYHAIQHIEERPYTLPHHSVLTSKHCKLDKQQNTLPHCCTVHNSLLHCLSSHHTLTLPFPLFLQYSLCEVYVNFYSIYNTSPLTTGRMGIIIFQS